MDENNTINNAIDKALNRLLEGSQQKKRAFYSQLSTGQFRDKIFLTKLLSEALRELNDNDVTELLNKTHPMMILLRFQHGESGLSSDKYKLMLMFLFDCSLESLDNMEDWSNIIINAKTTRNNILDLYTNFVSEDFIHYCGPYIIPVGNYTAASSSSFAAASSSNSADCHDSHLVNRNLENCINIMGAIISKLPPEFIRTAFDKIQVFLNGYINVKCSEEVQLDIELYNELEQSGNLIAVQYQDKQVLGNSGAKYIYLRLSRYIITDISYSMQYIRPEHLLEIAINFATHVPKWVKETIKIIEVLDTCYITHLADNKNCAELFLKLINLIYNQSDANTTVIFDKNTQTQSIKNNVAFDDNYKDFKRLEEIITLLLIKYQKKGIAPSNIKLLFNKAYLINSYKIIELLVETASPETISTYIHSSGMSYLQMNYFMTILHENTYRAIIDDLQTYYSNHLEFRIIKLLIKKNVLSFTDVLLCCIRLFAKGEETINDMKLEDYEYKHEYHKYNNVSKMKEYTPECGSVNTYFHWNKFLSLLKKQIDTEPDCLVPRDNQPNLLMLLCGVGDIWGNSGNNNLVLRDFKKYLLTKVNPYYSIRIQGNASIQTSDLILYCIRGNDKEFLTYLLNRGNFNLSALSADEKISFRRYFSVLEKNSKYKAMIKLLFENIRDTEKIYKNQGLTIYKHETVNEFMELFYYIQECGYENYVHQGVTLQNEEDILNNIQTFNTINYFRNKRGSTNSMHINTQNRVIIGLDYVRRIFVRDYPKHYAKYIKNAFKPGSLISRQISVVNYVRNGDISKETLYSIINDYYAGNNGYYTGNLVSIPDMENNAASSSNTGRNVGDVKIDWKNVAETIITTTELLNLHNPELFISRCTNYYENFGKY